MPPTISRWSVGAHRPVGLAEPLERAGHHLGDEGEEEADQEDQAGDHLEDADRPLRGALVVVQAGGVEQMQVADQSASPKLPDSSKAK